MHKHRRCANTALGARRVIAERTSRTSGVEPGEVLEAGKHGRRCQPSGRHPGHRLPTRRKPGRSKQMVASAETGATSQQHCASRKMVTGESLAKHSDVRLHSWIRNHALSAADGADVARQVV